MEIDKVTSRSLGVDIMTLDLTVSSQLQLLLDIIVAEKDRLLMVFIATSYARSRPVKSSLLRGRPANRPLRTIEQPEAKDNLKGIDKLKTEMANELYAAITGVILLACTGKQVCINLLLFKRSLLISTTAAMVEVETNSRNSGATRSGWNHSG
jgi:hypothetical protein